MDLIELHSKPIQQNVKRAIDGFIHKCKSYANEPANYNSRKRPFKVLNVDVKSRGGSQWRRNVPEQINKCPVFFFPVRPDQRAVAGWVTNGWFLLSVQSMKIVAAIIVPIGVTRKEMNEPREVHSQSKNEADKSIFPPAVKK